MGQENKYDRLIAIAIRKYGKKLQKADHEDIRQECELALFEAGADVPDQLAYRIIQRRVIDYLRRQPPSSSSIEDPDVQRKCDKQSVHFPDLDSPIDARKAFELVDNLPSPYKEVIHFSFRTEKPDSFVATLFGKSERWVGRVKKIGLIKLRNMMEG